MDQLVLLGLGLLAALGGLLGLFFQGVQRGRQAERTEREIQIHRQAEQARKEVRDVEQTNANRTDDDVRDAARKWVRKQP